MHFFVYVHVCMHETVTQYFVVSTECHQMCDRHVIRHADINHDQPIQSPSDSYGLASDQSRCGGGRIQRWRCLLVGYKQHWEAEVPSRGMWLIGYMYCKISFSSADPKAKLTFSKLNLSVGCCRKLFTFSSSSQVPLGQFQRNLAQSIVEWRWLYM